MYEGYVSGDLKEMREHDAGVSEKYHHGLKNINLKALSEENLQCIPATAGTSEAGEERTRRKLQDEVRQVSADRGVQMINSL